MMVWQQWCLLGWQALTLLAVPGAHATTKERAVVCGLVLVQTGLVVTT